ncbi:glycosyltransferase [bacterium]|nr:glycosyltransferase [bacterium]
MFVSVIIPTYNRLVVLKRAIESVLCQTHRDFELIIVDDGSTDGTVEFLRTIEDERLRVISISHAGVSAARNKGITNSRSELVAFLDSDDEWMDDKLEKQLQYIHNNPDVRVVQTEEIWVRDGKRVNPMKKHKKHSGWIFEPCIPLCIVSPSAVMIHQEVFKKCGMFDESLPACEDYDLWLRIALEYPIITMDEKLIVKYGGHADQLSRTTPVMDSYRILALKKILNHPKITPSQKKMVEESIAAREKIIQQGALKRLGKPLTSL